jgi:hypothetical protein
MPRCMGTFVYNGAPRLRGRRQVVIILSVPCNPLCSGIHVGVRKSAWLTGRPVPRDLSGHLTLMSRSNHVICMIFNCSLHGYIRISLLHLGTSFYSLFLFYPWGWPKCVSTILKTPCVTPALNFGSLCKHVILFISMLDSLHHAFLWESMNNDTLNTSGWNTTMVDPCACGYCFYNC